MSQMNCSKCGYLFESGDKVKATIITEWVALRSKVHYALAKPEECLEVFHKNCQRPKGDPDGD